MGLELYVKVPRMMNENANKNDQNSSNGDNDD